MSKFIRKASKNGGRKASNELELFSKRNISGLSNVLVYLFWIILSSLFNDFDHISFPVEFIDEVRQALNTQYQKIYFHYLLRLKQSITDNIIEILPFLLAESIRYAI